MLIFKECANTCTCVKCVTRLPFRNYYNPFIFYIIFLDNPIL